MKIMIIEDDSRMAATLEKGLRESGYLTVHRNSAESAVEDLKKSHYDLVVLDLGLPGQDGFYVLKYLKGKATPVIILTARDTTEDKIKGLDAGADDYLVKPFAFPELLARIRASLRRSGDTQETNIKISDLQVNALNRTALRGDTTLELTTREFDLLWYLAKNKGEPVSRDMLTHDVWHLNSRATSLDNVIDVHICHLRNAIDKKFTPPLIHTIRGIGFVLEDRS